MRKALSLLCFACLPLLASHADEVTLNSGGTLEGEIVKETPEGITLKASFGTVDIPRDNIAAIERKGYVPPPPRKEEPPPAPAPKPSESTGPEASVLPSPGKPGEKGLTPEQRAAFVSQINTACAAFTAFDYSKEAEVAADSLVAAGKDIVPVITDMLPDASAIHQKWLIQVLQKIGDPRAVDVLLGMINSPKGEVRGVSARALGTLQDPRAVKPLVHAMDDGDWTVRRDTASALQAFREKALEAVPVLIEHLSDVNLFVRSRAHDALRDITGQQDISSNPDDWKAWLVKQPPLVPERKDATGRPLPP